MSARPGLCGGHRATGVPTAIANNPRRSFRIADVYGSAKHEAIASELRRKVLNFGPLDVSVSANPSSRIIRFSTFEVNLQTGELRQRGQKVKLQEQPFQVLAALLERPGEMVTREELRSRLWPADTFVDFDHSLNAAIKRLRDALGESAETPIFIETACSTRVSLHCSSRRWPRCKRNRNRGRPGAKQIIFLASLGRHRLPLSDRDCRSAVGTWRRSRRAASEVIERKLTANSSENSVSSAAISPDGKYLAYADNTGYLPEADSHG